MIDSIRFVARLMRLGAGPRGRLGVLAAALDFRLALARSVPPRRERTLRLAHHGRRFALTVTNMADLHVLREVFLDGEYALGAQHAGTPPVDTIVDLGANIGVSVRFFALEHPAARILAVEPDPRAFALLERNTADLPQVTRVRAAAGDHDGEMTLYVGDELWSSSMTAHDGAATETTVPMRTLASLLAEWSDGDRDGHRDGDARRAGRLLKVDIEGGEHAVLAQPGVLDGVHTVLGEYHERFCPATQDEFFGLLRDAGFTVAPVGDAGEIPFAARRPAPA